MIYRRNTEGGTDGRMDGRIDGMDGLMESMDGLWRVGIGWKRVSTSMIVLCLTGGRGPAVRSIDRE
jgi:hypothetical protein